MRVARDDGETPKPIDAFEPTERKVKVMIRQRGTARIPPLRPPAERFAEPPRRLALGPAPEPTPAPSSNSTLRRVCSGISRSGEVLSTRIGHLCTLRKNPLMRPKDTKRRASIPSRETSSASIHWWDRRTRQKFGVQPQEDRPWRVRVPPFRDVERALLHDRLVGRELRHAWLERVHVRVLEDVHHHDYLVDLFVVSNTSAA